MAKDVIERLRAGGIEAKKGKQVLAPVSALWFAPKGHALHDPRSQYPTDEAMAEDMAARHRRGDAVLDHAILAREEPQGDGTVILHVCDGHQRTKALTLAEQLLKTPLTVKVDLIDGDDAEFIEERTRRNSRQWDKADKPSVLAVRVRQLLSFGRETKAIAAVMPKGIGPAEVEAIARWKNLTAEARERFDADAPLGLLAAVLDAPRDEQVATLDRLMANGVRTAKGATRQANKAKDSRDPWARRMSPRQAVRMAADVSNAVFGAQSIDTALHTLAKFGKRESAIVTAGLIAGLHIGANESTEAVLDALPANIANAIRDARQKGRKA